MRPSAALRAAAWGITPPAVAYLAQALLWPVMPPEPQLFFFPAVAVAALRGGLPAGLIATGLSAIGMLYGFMPPYRELAVDIPRDAIDLGMFLALAAIGIVLLDRLMRARAAAAEAAARAEVAKRETAEVLAVVAHDVHGPVSTIAAAVPELERAIELGDTRQARELAARVRRAAETASALSDPIERRPLELRPAIFSAAELAQDAVRLAQAAAAARRVRIAVDAPSALRVSCDHGRALEALSRLVANAIRFAPEGGTVAVRVRADGKDARFEVQDAGPRPSEGARDLVLPMDIAKRVVDAHGGRIAAEDGADGGALLWFTLPGERRRGRAAAR